MPVQSLQLTDFSEEMVTLAQAKAVALKSGSQSWPCNVTARRMDGQQLQYADGTFFAATAMFSVLFFPDRAAGLGEMRRVLRRGEGACLVAGWAPARQVEWIRFSNQALKEVVGSDSLKMLMSSQREEVLDAPSAHAQMQERLVDDLTAAKRKAVEEEDFDQAKEIKLQIESLLAQGKDLQQHCTSEVPSFAVWADQEVLAQELKEAGFHAVRTSAVTRSFALGSGAEGLQRTEDMWQDMAASFPHTRFSGRRTEDARLG